MKELEELKVIIKNLNYNKVIDDIELATMDRILHDAECEFKNLHLQNVTNRALLLKIERLEADNKLLNFMVENGLGEEDMINDITYPHEL